MRLMRDLQNSARAGETARATVASPLFALWGRRFRLPRPLAAEFCKYLCSLSSAAQRRLFE